MMHVIRVSPLAKLPSTVPQVLDYFWSDPLPQGALVQAPLGRRSVVAIVLESSDLEKAKLTIKKSSFGLKKISKVVQASPQVSPSQLAMARWLSRQYDAPLGMCMRAVLPPWLGKRDKFLEIPNGARSGIAGAVPEIILTQPDTALAQIRQRIRSATGQILVLVPEVTLCGYLAGELADLAPTTLHSELGANEHFSSYTSVMNGSARLVIGTRSALFLPWHSLSDIIIEDPLHEAYKSDMTPRYVTADAAREMARLSGASLTYLTPALSTVNHYLSEKGILTLTDKKPHWPRIVMADMLREQQNGNRSMLARTSQETLCDAYEDRKRILFFSPRRAYTTMTRCRRCHTAVSCATCSIPLRVHRYDSQEMLICYHCAAYIAMPKQCPTCHAGELKPSGLAGSQKVAQAINDCLDRYGLNKTAVPILDSDLVRASKDAGRILQELNTVDHPILVATQMIFSHRYTQKFDHVVIVQADALSYNPDFRTQERLIYQLEKLADLGPKTMTIQYWDDQGVLADAPERSWTDFYRQELKALKELDWPPFTRLVKITTTHRDRRVSERQSAIAGDRLRRAAGHLGLTRNIQVLGPTPALVERAGGRWAQTIILKTTLATERLRELLAHIPPGAVIDIDPRSIS